MTIAFRKTLAPILTAAGLALAGSALISAPALAGGGHGWHHGGHFHGHFGKGWGGWGFGGHYPVSYGIGHFGGDCVVVRRKVFVPGIGFVRKRETVCG